MSLLIESSSSSVYYPSSKGVSCLDNKIMPDDSEIQGCEEDNFTSAASPIKSAKEPSKKFDYENVELNFSSYKGSPS